jgi:hypothetical protein
MEDDQYSILENSPLPRHRATRGKELSEIGDVSFKRLSTLLH